jgi:hypothetical protein
MAQPLAILSCLEHIILDPALNLSVLLLGFIKLRLQFRNLLLQVDYLLLIFGVSLVFEDELVVFGYLVLFIRLDIWALHVYDLGRVTFSQQLGLD